ncbi:hypothetical protein [Salipiger aestuarii]|uniref:hypothetical protein n=1 Tax=Salipiger aestuarii TaxID=568098 RepID=UPI001CC290FF|nr:hypothetical protein [Salipiger aestuarii]
MSNPALFPDHTKPADLAGHFGVSERTLREKVRAIDAFAMLGRTMVLFPEHVEALKEAMKCPSRSTSAERSGTTGALLPGGDFEALQARLTKKSPKGSRRVSKRKNGEVISMDRGRI